MQETERYKHRDNMEADNKKTCSNKDVVNDQTFIYMTTKFIWGSMLKD